VPLIRLLKKQKQSIIARFNRASDLRGFGQVLNSVLPIVALWFVAVIGAELSYWWVVAATLLMSLFTLRILVLMHECGHGSLFRTPALNQVFGFFFGVIAGMPQYVWSQHHDYHHATNGNWDKYRGPLTTPSVTEFDAMTESQRRSYLRIRSLAFAPIGGFGYLLFFPRFNWIKGTIALLVHVVKRKLAEPNVAFKTHAASFESRVWKSPKEYWHMAWNNIVLLSAWVLMCMAVGPALFFSVYVISVSLAGGAGIMLFTVQHNFEHAYASETKDWDYDVGAMEGTSFLVLPRWLNWFTANIAYHHVHHLSAKIPNYCLVACHNENLDLFARVPRVTLWEIPKALKCLIWDAQARRIISVAEYESRRRELSASRAV
jgi:acyl-lipid omega-6 desaturase (Delta-12 desaturase)